MYPELLHIGPLTIHSYGVFYALGIVAAVVLSERLHRLKGGVPGQIVDMSLPVVAGVLVGARILFVIVEHEYYLRQPLEILMVWKGGLVFYGGLMGGFAAFILTARRMGFGVRETADTLAPGLALGHAIGRIGCFMAGSCYGRPTDLPWAVTFTDPGSLAGAVLGVPVHPTQLYSSAFLLLLSAILIMISRRRAYRGQVAVTYALLYGTFRFSMEFLRGDPRGEWDLLGLTLSTSQWLSVVLVISAITVHVLVSRKEGARHGSGKVLLQDKGEPSLQ